jgi:hypothetical protein
MDFKSIFIKSDESSDDKQIEKVPVKKEESFKFPESGNTPVERSIPKQSTPTPKPSFGFGFGGAVEPEPIKQEVPMFVPTGNVSVSDEQVDKAYGIYQRGFDSLNTDGYDFYEYYTMVAAGGMENTPIYPMAFAMGKSVSPSITKDALTSKADYYMDEINKVYQNFSAQGSSKIDEISTKKNNENQNLVHELESIKTQIESLLVQQASCERKLGDIDSKYAGQLNDVQTMIKANSIAKEKFIGQIQTVKNGIINNVN